MKRLIPFCVAFLFASPCWGQIAFKSHAAGANASNSVTVTISVSSGDTVVVCAGIAAAGMTVSSVTDTGANAYAHQISAANGSVNDAEIWTSIATAAATSVTVHYSASGNNGVEIATYTGVNSIGSSFSNTGTGTTISSGAQTVSSSSDFLVAALVEGTSTGSMTAQNGNLRGAQAMNGAGRVGAVDNTGSTSLTDSVTIPGTQAWVGLSLDLKANGGGGVSLPPTQMSTGVGD